DTNLRTSDTLALRYSQQWVSRDRPGFMPGNLIGGHATLDGTNVGITETHTFGPKMVNEFRTGWNYVRDGNLLSNQDVVSELAAIPGAVVEPGYPDISMRNVTRTRAVRPLTTIPTPYYVWQNSLQYMDNLGWFKNNHALKFGVEYIHHRNDVGGGYSSSGVKFAFDAFQTVPFVGARRENNRTAIADALLGLSNQYTTYYQFDKTRMRSQGFSAFVQDDWRVTRKLSLSIGLRYEAFPQWR